MSVDIAGLIDHTNLKPYASLAEIEKLIREAAQFGTYAICINPIYAKFARNRIREDGLNLRIAVVVDFPFGSSTTEARIDMIKQYAMFADELDTVAPIGLIKSGLIEDAEHDMAALVETAHSLGSIIKIIAEDAYTTRDEKLALYKIIMKSGADFIKTSTGFEDGQYAVLLGNKTGAQVENVRLMAELSKQYNPRIGIKASGGIRSYEQAIELLRASGRPAVPNQFRIGASKTREILGK